MKIPRYQSQELPAIPSVSAGAAAAPYEARAQLGGAVADLGQKIFETEMQIQEGERRSQNAIDELKFTNEYSETLTKAMVVKRPNNLPSKDELSCPSKKNRNT